MLLPSTRPYCQPLASSELGIVLLPIKALHAHFKGLSRLSLPNRNKKTALRIDWSWADNIISPCRKRLDCEDRLTRCTMAVIAILLMEPGMAYDTRKTWSGSNFSSCVGMDISPPLYSNEAMNVAPNLSNQESRLLVCVEVSGEMKSLDFKETEQQTREKREKLRRNKISEAKKGTIPWNKGRKGGLSAPYERPLPKIEPISSEEKELLRRRRISEANRGRIPWNKGGIHSQETKELIRVRVTERMKDPKIRELLRLQALAVKQSPEIKLKIKNGILNAWKAKKIRRAKQDLCISEWRERIAECARKGGEGDIVYEWNSYSTMKREHQTALRAPPREKRPEVLKGDLSMEHKLRISAAIKAKWADPKYRDNVKTGIQESLVKRGMSSKQTAERQKPKVDPTFTRPKASQVATKLKSSGMDAKPKISHSHVSVRHDHSGFQNKTLETDIIEPDSSKVIVDLPAYKDPETHTKLERLKLMRIRRQYVEAQKQRVFTERARVLIAQAEQAAKYLEAAAVKDKNALAPLLETRRLLAEAVSSLESMNLKKSRILTGKDMHVMSLDEEISTPSAMEGDYL